MISFTAEPITTTLATICSITMILAVSVLAVMSPKPTVVSVVIVK